MKKIAVITILFTLTTSIYADIKVGGTGEIQVPANRARLSFSIITKNADSKIASEENAKITTKVTKMLFENMKFTKNNIKTTNYNLRPVYTYINNQPPKFEGIEVSNDLQIKEVSIDKISELIKELSTQKISEIRNIEFYHNDIESFNEECLNLAVENAKHKAQILANKAGIKLGHVKEIIEQSDTESPISPVMFKARSESMRSNVLSGELTITKSINVTYGTKE